MPEVRVATFNVENLFARFKFDKGIDPEQAVEDGWNAEETAFDIMRPDEKRISGGAIKAAEADIVCLQEVENLDTLKRFRSDYLGGGGKTGYPYALAIDGNDPRLIDVAVLSKHPIVHARSYAQLRTGSTYLFSRDCLEVDVLVGKKPLTLFVQHYKSMMGGRAKTRARRVVQTDATIEIINDRFGNKPGGQPFVVLGDFNDYMQTDDEGEPAIGALVEWDQVENVVERLPVEDQWTHYYDDRDKYTQLDYLLPSASLAESSPALPEIVRVGMPRRAKRYTGKRLPGVGDNKPKASDHCAVVATLNL
jgi:endonuclease/exonuclease/phosphatase family metal-dependent hydrolase